MKKLVPILVMLFISFSCSTTNSLNDINRETNKMAFEPNDDGEYDIIVMDPQYEIFLSTSPQKEMYTKDYYKLRNRNYTVIWNQRHMMPSVYNPNLYAVSIDLDPTIDYGYNFEYKLFNFFRFIEWKYRVRLR